MLRAVGFELQAEDADVASLRPAQIGKRTKPQVLVALGSVSTVRALGKAIATTHPCFQLRHNSAEGSAIAEDG